MIYGLLGFSLIVDWHVLCLLLPDVLILKNQLVIDKKLYIIHILVKLIFRMMVPKTCQGAQEATENLEGHLIGLGTRHMKKYVNL